MSCDNYKHIYTKITNLFLMKQESCNLIGTFFGTTFALFSKISASVWETNLFVAIIPLHDRKQNSIFLNVLFFLFFVFVLFCIDSKREVTLFIYVC
jgi:hypothetical protein